MARATGLAVTATLTGLVATSAISTDLYLPSLPAIARTFDSSVAQVQLTLSVFLAGFAISQVVSGPLSDLWGRRPVLIGGLGLYLLATIACVFAPTIEVLIAARFIQALGGCCGVVLARAVLRDLYERQDAARMLSFMAVAMALAPAIGPIIGGFLQTAFGWQANFWALFVFGSAILLCVALLLPETNAYREEGGINLRRIAANYRTLCRDRVFLGYSLIAAAGYSGIFSVISGSSFLFIDGLGLPPHLYGLSFGTIIVGYMAGAFLSGRLNRSTTLDRLLMIGAILACVGGLSGAVLTLAGHVSVAGLIVPSVVYFCGCGLLLPNATACAIANYPKMAGTASALLGFLQMLMASLVGIAVGHLADHSGRAMTVAIALVAMTALLSRLYLVSEDTALAPADQGSRR